MRQNIDEFKSTKKSSVWLTLWRAVNGVMTIFFVLCTIVQVNDPDPFLWVPAYMIPALFSFSMSVNPHVKENALWIHLCSVCLMLYLCGFLAMLFIVIEVLAGDIHNPLIHEEGRELAGTLIALLWLATCRFMSFADDSWNTPKYHGILLATASAGLFPFVFWAICYTETLSHLGHCKDMFVTVHEAL